MEIKIVPLEKNFQSKDCGGDLLRGLKLNPGI